MVIIDESAKEFPECFLRIISIEKQCRVYSNYLLTLELLLPIYFEILGLGKSM